MQRNIRQAVQGIGLACVAGSAWYIKMPDANGALIKSAFTGGTIVGFSTDTSATPSNEVYGDIDGSGQMISPNSYSDASGNTGVDSVGTPTRAPYPAGSYTTNDFRVVVYDDSEGGSVQILPLHTNTGVNQPTGSRAPEFKLTNFGYDDGSRAPGGALDTFTVHPRPQPPTAFINLYQPGDTIGHTGSGRVSTISLSKLSTAKQYVGIEFEDGQAAGETILGQFSLAYDAATQTLTVGDVYYDPTTTSASSTEQIVPEPASLSLLAVGAAGLLARRRRTVS